MFAVCVRDHLKTMLILCMLSSMNTTIGNPTTHKKFTSLRSLNDKTLLFSTVK